MCLSSIAKVLSPPQMMTFYKVMCVDLSGKTFQPTHRAMHLQFRMGTKKFYRSTKGTLEPSTWRSHNWSYKTGFHGWTNLKSARSWREGEPHQAIVKCEGLVHTIGHQVTWGGGGRAVVAGTMRILEVVIDSPARKALAKKEACHG